MAERGVHPLVYVSIGVPMGMVLFFVLFAFSSAHLFPSYDPFPFILNGTEGVQISQAQQKALVQLINSGAVLNPQDLITELTAFYTLMFQAMAFLLAVFSGAAFLFIKARSEESIQRSVKDYIDTHLKSQEFSKHIADSTSEVVEPFERRMDQVELTFSDLEDLDSDLKEIPAIRKDLDAIASKLASMDTTESEVDTKFELQGGEE